ncbi:hypothetical protein G3N96_04990 [Burkholderia sp. Se-20373]|uniref:hypothetical protein n=1 Tax=Burkholderia sp. Se-20373 TaxID=2703898 RepID=UPI001981E58C|nr:hypothetical protein [Burkholderia sp. Se-20373]MBN3744792.1 hypothetical protein [Burkholderia sp. Se-20373]
MPTILKRVKRASLASHRRSAAIARLRMAFSMDTMEMKLPGIESLAELAQSYRPHVEVVRQDLEVLQTHYSNAKQD